MFRKRLSHKILGRQRRYYIILCNVAGWGGGGAAYPKPLDKSNIKFSGHILILLKSILLKGDGGIEKRRWAKKTN